MAQTFSNVVTNILNNPTIASQTFTVSAPSKTLRDSVIVPDTANADTIILGPLPVTAVIEELELTTADLGSAGTFDVGVFRPIYSGDTITFTAVDKDCIADNLNVSLSASSAIAPQRFAGLSADALDKQLWEIAGLTAKPAYPLFYIGITTDTGTTIAGTVTIDCKYTLA